MRFKVHAETSISDISGVKGEEDDHVESFKLNILYKNHIFSLLKCLNQHRYNEEAETSSIQHASHTHTHTTESFKVNNYTWNSAVQSTIREVLGSLGKAMRKERNRGLKINRMRAALDSVGHPPRRVLSKICELICLCALMALRQAHIINKSR